MKGKHIVIILLVLIIIFIIFLVLSKKSSTTNNSSLNNNTQENNNGSILGTITSSISGSFPLHKGSVGKNVTTLQNFLNSKGAGLVPDGIFGSLTAAALLKYTGQTSVSQDYFNQFVLGNTSTLNQDIIGKTVYAGYYGCTVYQSDFATYNNVYKFGANGEWLGVISGTKTSSDSSLIYLLGEDYYVAAKCAVIK